MALKVGSLVKYVPDIIDMSFNGYVYLPQYGVVIEVCNDTNEISLSWFNTGYVARYDKNIDIFSTISE